MGYALSDQEFLECSERRLARILNVDPAQLNRNLTGVSDIKLGTIRRWSSVLAIPAGRLVELIIRRQELKEQRQQDLS